MANTDRAGTMKRSRGDSTEPDVTVKPTKKRKKQKGQTKKNQKENNKASAGDSASKEQEITATPEGLAMTQVLNTLNKLEKSRFEAFRRSTLPGNAVSEYLAHLLLLQNEHLVARTKASSRLLGAGTGMGLTHLEQAVKQQGSNTPKYPYKKSSKHIGTKKGTRPLDDLVSPNNADSIVVVASSLAKAYAQRLVTAAKRVAIAEGNYVEGIPLQPHHVEQAHEARVQAGLDPGFFLQKPGHHGIVCGKVVAAALGRVDRHDLLRQAALQAQEEYDQYQADGKPAPLPQKGKEEEQKLRSQPEPPTDELKTEHSIEKNGKPAPLPQKDTEEEEKQEAQLEPSPSELKSEPSLEENTDPIELHKKIKAEEEKSEEKNPEEQKPETQEAEEQKPVSIELDPNVLDEFSSDDEDEVSTKLPEALSSVAAAVLPPVPAPAPKATSAAPMSMEDALFNDLDSDDSDDDD